MRGRLDEARQVLDLMHKSTTEQEKEEILSGGEVDGPRTPLKLSELFNKANRSKTWIAVYLMGSQQLSGIDGVLYYAPVLFIQAGLPAATAAFYASGVTGIILVVVSVLVQPWMDHLGRRPLTIYGGCGISLTLFILGVLYASKAAETEPVAKWAVIILIELYVICFASTWAMSMSIFASEIQPNRTRGAATSLAVAVNQGINFIVALTTPLFLQTSASGPYFLFSCFSALVVIVCIFFMPESRGLSLEAIDAAFQERAYLDFWRSNFLRLSAKLRSFGARRQALRELEVDMELETVGTTRSRLSGDVQ